eukprot:TRINITY_DN68938_c0_g1_i1.p1 TRINITY_DN68938_c0_g1~~TRINITY_DN68938_c0_g1_i1.p1  ORF type:complete len:284 (+),score=26.06 TRINITY_DN68938_c0_g1_i1:52-852(+)
MAFAQKLRSTSSKVTPNLDKYIKQIKDDCLESAKGGYYKSSIYLMNWLGNRSELEEELKTMGLQVKNMSSFRTSLSFDVSWPSKEKSETQPVRKKPAAAVKSTAVRKKPTKKAGNSAKFASKLTSMSSKVVPTLEKYIKEVKDTCLEEAKRGYAKASIYLMSWLGDRDALIEELDMLGLKVKNMSSFKTSLSFDVSWPAGAAPCQPDGLSAGNHEGTCKVCLQQETMCRLHPCGHLIGSVCGAGFIKKACPFCRQKVRIAHAVFEP